MAKDPIYLIDAYIYIFQSHFSPYVVCLDKNGNDLSAVYGFTEFLLQFLRRVDPVHIAVGLDASLFCGFRHQLCPNYKSNRELPDENLAMQLQGCAEVCAALGLVAFASEVYEADDIIGTLANRLRKQSNSQRPVIILSRDKDLAQLLENERDCLWDYSGNRKRYRQDIFTEYGVHSEQIPDYLGLAGDSVDCITGVPGVGPVKAKKLLAQFGTLEEVYENLDKVAELPLRGAGKLGALLDKHKSQAELSRQLATIVTAVADQAEPFATAELDSISRKNITTNEFAAFLENYSFPSRIVNSLMSSAQRLAT